MTDYTADTESSTDVANNHESSCLCDECMAERSQQAYDEIYGDEGFTGTGTDELMAENDIESVLIKSTSDWKDLLTERRFSTNQ